MWECHVFQSAVYDKQNEVLNPSAWTYEREYQPAQLPQEISGYERCFFSLIFTQPRLASVDETPALA